MKSKFLAVIETELAIHQTMMKTILLALVLFVMSQSLLAALSPENEPKRREAHIDEMEARKAVAKAVVTSEVEQVRSKDGPCLCENRRNGWTNKVVLDVRVTEVDRACSSLEKDDMIKIRYEIHHPPNGRVGPITEYALR